MLRMSYTSPDTIQGVIRLRSKIKGLGRVTDVDGCIWDIVAIYPNYVCATPLSDLHPYYSDTSAHTNYGLVHQEWKPYKVVVVDFI